MFKSISLLLVSFFATVVSSQCGSLVTYRQHADLLQTAPKCLHDGCSPGKNASSISSICPSSSPCSLYWNLFVEQFDQKNSWCSTCSSDLACRIHGWPVMNATTMCETTTDTLIFGTQEGGCCVNDNEPFELAQWTGNLCNGSEWRLQFDICGGMACLDWREWIMPWNWTVTNETIPREDQKCTKPSQYLSSYAVEHFIMLLTAVLAPFVRLWKVRKRAETGMHPARYFLYSAWTGTVGRFRQYGSHVRDEKSAQDDGRPDFEEKLRWIYPLAVGMLTAGLSVGLDFIVAYLIKSKPGYHHVPLALLALLFSCRPRLTWLPCVLALITDKQLVKLGFVENSNSFWAARLVLSAVAVTSSVTEAIAQLLGAYFFGRTADVGRKREFYLIHHLRPKLRGKAARHMYLGALFWVILCIPLLILWFLIAAIWSKIVDVVTAFRRRRYRSAKRKAETLPPLVKRPVLWLLDYLDPDRHSRPPVRRRPTSDVQDMAVDSDQSLPVHLDSSANQPMPYAGPTDDRDNQIMPIHHGASSGYAQMSTGPQRRTSSGGRYGALNQQETINDDDQIMEVPRPANLARRPEMRQIRESSYADSHDSLLEGTGERTGPPVRRDTAHSNWTISTRFDDWEYPIILAGLIFGMLTFAAQWLFWDGFVKASGERFCPPDIFPITAIWWGGAPFVIGLPFLA